MRQTEEYKLNLLDGEDKLSPRPLNENMEKVEAALAANKATAAAELLRAVGVGNHNARIACGTYVGTGTYGSDAPNSITVDFCPALVVVMTASGVSANAGFIFVRGAHKAYWPNAHGTSNYEADVWWDNRSVYWAAGMSTVQLNAGITYCWVAIGYDDTDYGEA